MNLHQIIRTALIASLAATGGYALAKAAPKPIVVTPAKDVKWTPMDPTAGDKGPQFSVVFGDVKKKGPVGVLMRFPADAKPGPHTHSSDYWGVTITGVEHDFAPGAPDGEGAALPVGSWWFQPGNAVHDNHCEPGTECLMFVYLPSGFDMKPAKMAAAAAPAPTKPVEAPAKK